MSRNRKLLLVGGVLLVICAALSIGYVYLSNLSFDFLESGGCLGDEPYSEQTIEQAGNFTLPESARNLNATSRAWQDCLVYVTFEMDASDLDEFLETTYVAAPLTMTSTLSGFDDFAYGHWGLNRKQLYFYGGGGNGSSEGQYIAIDASDAETYKVYLISVLL